MWLQLNPEKDALFLDIDGTLLDIAPTASEVVVPPPLIADLERLRSKLRGALAFISGRSIQDVDQLFAPLRLACSGAHGAQWRLTPTDEIQSIAPLPETLFAAAAQAFADMPGVWVENKTYTLAVHYRKSPEMADQVASILMGLLPATLDDLTLIHGRKVVEIARLSHNKGLALDRLLNAPPFKNRRPLFLGDDVTDLSAFAACLKHGGVAARVGQGTSRQNAFASPEAVRVWIKKMAIEIV